MPALVSPIGTPDPSTKRARQVATTRASRGSRPRESSGRYDGGKARRLATGVAQPVYERCNPKKFNERVSGRPNAAHHSVPPLTEDTATTAVIDPMGNGIGRIQATVNRKVDVLERERSHGLISSGAYATGRIIQAVFEKASRLGGSNWAGHDAKDTRNLSDRITVNALETAREVAAIRSRMEAVLGGTGAHLVRAILVEGTTFERWGATRGPGGDRDTRYVSKRFREALEELSEAWSAKGARGVDPADDYARQGQTAIARQRLAMEAKMEARDAKKAAGGA